MAHHHLYLLESSVLPLEGLHALNIRRIFHYLLLAILDRANWRIPCPQTSIGLGREAHVVRCRTRTKARFSITITFVQLLLASSPVTIYYYRFRKHSHSLHPFSIDSALSAFYYYLLQLSIAYHYLLIITNLLHSCPQSMHVYSGRLCMYLNNCNNKCFTLCSVELNE